MTRLALLTCLCTLAACGKAGDPQAAPGVMIGAGDIAQCANSAPEQTARVIDTTSADVYTLGDNAYENGADTEFAACYAPTWGRFKSRTHPVPGNHDYGQPDASGYFAYFGERAGPPAKGWYAYDLGTWRVIALNSEVAMGPGSEQLTWLVAELSAAKGYRCVLAYWHRPRFSSGPHGDDSTVGPLWDALFAAGADVVLAGHDHHYERFSPQTPAGVADATKGIRQFIAGTGGAELRPIEAIKPNSEKRIAGQYGVLELTLREGSYEWRFLSATATAATVEDAGSGDCH